jgi:hypothetical protein
VREERWSAGCEGIGRGGGATPHIHTPANTHPHTNTRTCKHTSELEGDAWEEEEEVVVVVVGRVRGGTTAAAVSRAHLTVFDRTILNSNSR